MEQAIERLPAIPESQQDRVAAFVLQEVAEDERWAASTHDQKDRSETGPPLGRQARGSDRERPGR